MTNLKIAVLIDGDNAESAFIEQILAEAGNYGRVSIKRIYADWTNSQNGKWKDQLNKHAIRPMQKFSYTSGKNSTDTALIIEAMDLLHSKTVEGFCIVSSDSDYTGLAHRIREQGLFVMGIGRAHTPPAFVNACEKFTYVEILNPDIVKTNDNAAIGKDNISEQIGSAAPKLPGLKVIGKIDMTLIEPLKKQGVKSISQSNIDIAFNSAVNVNTGLAMLSRFSEAIRKIDTTFDHRNFGYNTFKQFCESLKPNYIIVNGNELNTFHIKKKE